MKVLLLLVFAVLQFSLNEGKVALVLSGGGAKGAWQAGVLQAMCETELADSWDMILGTSIGAFAGGALSQFNKDEQCELGVPAALEFWRMIETPGDVYESHGRFGGECLTAKDLLPMMTNWYESGGMCDSAPGKKLYSSMVSASAIRNSNMQFFYALADLDEARFPVWGDDQFPQLHDHIVASGAISPVVPAQFVNGKYYVDGGIHSNVPIVKALEEGATTVYTLLLSPLETDKSFDVSTAVNDDKLGPLILEYYMTILADRAFLTNELKMACTNYPNARIYAVIPTAEVGSLLDFDAAKIESMIQNGYNHFKQFGKVDLCEAAHDIIFPASLATKTTTKHSGRSTEHSSSSDDSDSDDESVVESTAFMCGMAGVVGVVVGGLVVFIINQRKQKHIVADVYYSVPLVKDP